MRTVTATAIVRPDHTLTVQVPEDIPSGTHQVIIVLQEETSLPQSGQLFTDWPAHQVGPVDPSMTYRREDIYGDDGR